jgi:Kef-type K+ transport system membrane component KefB
MLSDFDLSVRLFLQLAFILGMCRLVGWLARLIHQPQVVGEMIAGVVMGPSLLGWAFPAAQGWLFPEQSRTILFALSQVGLALYMFLVGVELRVDILRQRVRSAAAVSVAGMVTPFLLGGALGLWLVGEPDMFGPQVHRFGAALFVGAAMAITAFPMLARIIYERGLSGTSLGTLALTAGAIDDGAAWCVLAVVIASMDHTWSIAAKAIGGGVIYAWFVLTLGRRGLRLLGAKAEAAGRLTNPILAFTLALVMLAAWYTDVIGIYAVFGAFLLGVAMPHGFFAERIQRAIEPLVVALLLPLFFTYSGLNTRLDLVDTPWLWWVSLVVLAAACVGKGGACWLAARLCGEDNRTALAVGALMNARGLMELIILNIGLQRGIISPTFFSIMVVMAIATTLMAAPLFEWVYGRRARRQGELGKELLD